MIIIRHHYSMYLLGLILFFFNEVLGILVTTLLLVKYFCNYIIIKDSGIELGRFLFSNLVYKWSDIDYSVYSEWFSGVGVLEIRFTDGSIIRYYFVPYVNLVSMTINLYKLMDMVYYYEKKRESSGQVITNISNGGN